MFCLNFISKIHSLLFVGVFDHVFIKNREVILKRVIEKLTNSDRDLTLLKNSMIKDIEDLDQNYKHVDFFNHWVSTIIGALQSQVSDIDTCEHVSDEHAKDYLVSVQPVCNISHHC